MAENGQTEPVLIAVYDQMAERIQQHFGPAFHDLDVDSIHDMRVQIKRLRALFKLVGWIIPNFREANAFKPVRKLFKSAGPLRDVHVQQDLLRNWLSKAHHRHDTYYNYLKNREIEARPVFLKGAGRFDPRFFVKSRQGIEGLLNAYDLQFLDFKIRQLIRNQIDELKYRKYMEGAGDPEYHQIRIGSKEIRYTLEIYMQSFQTSEILQTLNDQIRGLHQSLGQWHDIEIAESFYFAFQKSSCYDQQALSNVDHKFTQYCFNKKHLHLKQFFQRWSGFEAFLRDNPEII